MSDTVDYAANGILIEIDETDPERDKALLNAYAEKSKSDVNEKK